MMWKNMVEADRLDDNITRLIRLACWITDTHLEYAVVTARPQHQWYTNLPECYVILTLPMS